MSSKSSRDKKNKLTSAMWNAEENTSERYGKGFHWVEAPQVLHYINTKTSNDPNLSWGDYVIKKYLLPSKGTLKGLSLGCGTGAMEIGFQKQKLFRQLDAIDIADKAIEQAKEAARKEKADVNFNVDDLNTITLPELEYDIVIANSSLHHIENLEYIIDQIEKTLKEDGFLIMCEYVGPSQFQYSERQIFFINTLLKILPKKYRTSVSKKGEVKKEFYPPSLQFMNAHDPSEAIRSADLMPMLIRHFDVMERHDFGGTLLHMLLQDIAGNFDPNDKEADEIIKALITLEDYLITHNILTSDFSFMVLKKRKALARIKRDIKKAVKKTLLRR